MLAREFDFEGALVTIANIEIGEDLKEARVKISVIPYEKEVAAYEEIEERRRELQHKLLKRLNIKPMPHLKFFIESHKNNEAPSELGV